MPDYPKINDREYDLIKKIAENTADIAAGGGGGGGAVSSVFGRTGAVTAQNGDYTKSQVGLGNVDNTSDANKPISSATQSALDDKAPINNPVLTGAIGLEADSNGLYLTVNGQQVINADEAVFQLRRPLTENPRDVGDGDASTVLYTDLIVNYVRTDSAPLVFPDPGGSSNGQNLKVTNLSGGTISLDGTVVGSFFDGANGVVNSISMADGETISFVSEGAQYRIVSRYDGVSASQSPANPTSTIGLTANNGVLSTYMRSDASPPIDQSITPTWTERHSFSDGITLAAAKNYEVIAANIGSDDRLILRAMSALGARFWFDSNTGTTGISFAEGGSEKVFFGTELGGNLVLDTKAYGLKLKTSGSANNALIDTSLLSADRAFQLPNAAGTLALRSDFDSGGYTPTVTPGTNTSSATANGDFLYIKVGSIVQISGSLDVTATASGPSLIQISLPVAPGANFPDTQKLSGSGAVTNGTATGAVYVRADSGTQLAVLDWIAPNNSAHTMRFQATYTIV